MTTIIKRLGKFKFSVRMREGIYINLKKYGGTRSEGGNLCLLSASETGIFYVK